MGKPDGSPVRGRIEDAHPLHRCRLVEPPVSERFVARAHALQPTWREASPPLQEHRQELRREMQLLRRHIHAAASAYGERVAAVAATRGRDPCRVQRIRQTFSAGRDGQDGGTDRRLRKAEAELPAKGGGPGAAGQDRQLGPDGSAFRDHAAQAAGLGLDTARSTILVHGAAELEDGAGDRGRGPRRVGGAVARREDAALPGPARGAAPLAGPSAVEHMRGYARRFGEITPARPAGQFRLVIAEVEQAAAAKAGVFAGFRREAVPQIEAARCHRQFAGVAVLLAAPSPVPGGLFGADASLFDERDLHAAPGQIVGREDADNAAADHHRVRGPWQLARCLDVLQRCAHGPSTLKR